MPKEQKELLTGPVNITVRGFLMILAGAVVASFVLGWIVGLV